MLTWLRSDPQSLSSLPSDARTLLKTPRTVTLDVMGCGKFYYFGLQKNLVHIVNKYSDVPDKLKLHFNIDGLPIYKSKATSFWPILCRIKNFDNEHPFSVAVFCGSAKPPLEDFYNNMTMLVNY